MVRILHQLEQKIKQILRLLKKNYLKGIKKFKQKDKKKNDTNFYRFKNENVLMDSSI